MGFDASCHLVYGVRVERFEDYQEVVRYNEVTGQPYQKRVLKKGYRTVDAGVDLVGIDSDELYCVDYESDDGYFLGQEITSHLDRRGLGQYVIEVGDVPENIRASVAELLGRFGVAETPKLYAYTSLSY